jgi:threonine/homoserine/homoserine lactone efflux protein
LIVNSAIAFTTLKYVGAAYLFYLGVRTLLAKAQDAGPQVQPPLPARTLFVRGFLTNVLNPKVALFVLAFLPQFVSPAHGPVWSQMLELGALWYVAGFLYLATLGFVVGRLRSAGTPSVRLRNGFRWATATIFIGLGIRVALPESR